ncbi:hypothetical protein [Shewanella sp. YLB-07]|uniref:hypothetical protein n=1 Tax=Shewanella sp. YLB-07 TaxID=2601268 RepID=UPI00128E4FE0|nr:hypothetical protein [Shewanella sp. YLB-07]MPY23819.1 hypothetical protein [Shewanella sp. YLB-07]
MTVPIDKPTQQFKLNTFLLILSALTLIGVAIYMWSSQERQADNSSVITHNANLDPKSEQAMKPVGNSDEAMPEANKDLLQFKQALSDNLKQEFPNGMAGILKQLSLIEVRAYVIENYHDEGISIFNEVITSVFPSWAHDILSAIATMDIYNAWLLDSMAELNTLPFLERNGQLWNKRNQLFGNNAKLIWSDELDRIAAREANMQQTIALLDAADDTEINERLVILQSALEDNYGGEIQNLLISKGMIADIFFRFGSVQRDLAAMDVQDRQAQIDNIRRDLLYDEDQIAYLADQDQIKEENWQTGYAYMTERKAMMATLTGPQLDLELESKTELATDVNQQQALQTALSSLREKYFEQDSSTISKEEQNGFYRYTRPRIYGRN